MTLKEIAKIVGVSSSTVSLVLNKQAGVSAATRERVESALREYQYMPQKRSKSDRADVTSIYLVKYATHGMIVEENQGFISAIVDQIIQESNKASMDVSVVNCTKHSILQVINDIAVSGAKGVIFIGTELTAQQIGLLKNIHIPLVVVDNACMYQNLSTILMTNQDIAYIATRYLIEAGYREIGYLCSNTSSSNFYWRRCGYEIAIKDHQVRMGVNIPLTPTLQKAYEDMSGYLKSADTLPKAFFADNDTIAIGAMKAMQEAGYRIPEDISIIGVDNIPYSAICTPPLTTVSISRVEMGKQAVAMLRYLIEYPDTPPLRTQVCGELMIRKSTKPA